MEKNILNSIKNLDKLPKLPQVLLKILEICNRDETDRDELIRVISSDAGLTARLMQLLNSAWVNMNKEIQSIESAILYLGIPSIKNLAISISVLQVFDSEKSLCDFNMNTFWYHSFKCAMLAKKMAGLTAGINPDEAFLAGLMHDIGKLILIVNYHEKYLDLLKEAEDDLHLAVLEQKNFDLTHSEVGWWLCQQWNFSQMVSDSVLYVSDSIDRVEESIFTLVKIVYAVNHFSFVADLTGEIDDRMVALIAIDHDTLESVMAEVENELQSMADSLGFNIPGQILASVSGRQCLTIEKECHSDEVAVELLNDALKSKVKEYSLLYGTLETLLNSVDRPSVLDALDMGLKILFNVSTVFCFLCDHQKKILTGCSHRKGHRERILNSIGISLTNRNSLLVKSLITRQLLSSLTADDQKALAISDVQIIRLLEADVMFCVPMHLPEKTVGVIAIGVDRDKAPDLIENTGVLIMLAKFASISLDHHQQRNDHAKLIQRERAGAASDSIQKVIHEINNPLLIITSYLKMVSVKFPESHPIQKELTVIDEEIERIGGLVKELSLVSRLPVSQFEWVDVAQLFSSMLEIVKKSILTHKGIEADIFVEPDFPRVKTDKNGLKQILINLLKNSSEALGKGDQIHISLKQVPGSVKIMIDEKRKTAGQIEIVVRDTGPGISDEIMKRLFEPYNSSKEANNSGLGLSIVNTTVRNLNGTIECHTKKNVGTEFKIVLPVSSSSSGLPLKAARSGSTEVNLRAIA